MGRLIHNKAVSIAALTALAFTALVTCENGIDLKADLEVEVMKSNDKYLEVTSIDIPLNLETSEFNPTGTIKIYFDRAVDPDSITNETIVIRDSDGNDVAYPAKGVEYVASAFLVRIRVYPYLDTNTDFTLMIAGVRGADGSVIHDIPSRTFRTEDILAGSIDAILSKDEASADGYTNSSIVDISCTVGDRFDLIKYSIALDYETSDSPEWYEFDSNFAYPSGGTFTIENFDLGRAELNGYGEGPLRLTVLFLGKNSGDTNFTPGIADTADIFVDTSRPAGGEVSINSGAPWSSEAAVTVSLADMDDGTITSGLAAVSFSNDALTWSEFSALTESAAWNLVSDSGGSADRGERHVYARVRDGAGNISDAISGTIGFDDIKPSAGIWLINGGAQKVYQTGITVESTTMPSDGESGVSEMRFSNDGSAWSDWAAALSTKAWDLLADPGGTSGDGDKSVYVQIRDTAGNVSDSASDGIYYSSTPPAVTAPDLAEAHDTGISNTDNITKTSEGLTFTVTAESGISIELLDTTNSGVYSGTSTALANGNLWTFSGISLSEGPHTMQANIIGDTTSSFDYITVTIDTVAPAAPATGDDATINTRLPSWSWESGGGGGSGLFHYTSSVLAASDTATTNTTISASASLADGMYELSVTEDDTAGNTSDPAIQTITVNAPPATPTVTSSVSVTLATSVAWSWSSNGYGSGVFRYQLDSISDAGWSTPTSSTSVTLSGLSDTTHYLYVEEQDAGGEWSSYGSRAVRITPVIPYNGQTRVSTTPTLQWRSAGITTISYDIYAQDPNTGVFVEVATVTGTSYTVTSALPALTAINWYLVAHTSKVTTVRMPTKGYYTFTTYLR